VIDLAQDKNHVAVVERVMVFGVAALGQADNLAETEFHSLMFLRQ
jgi:hypothetical protein